MSYQILFSDIDGTLLNEDRELSPFTITEIRRIKNTMPIILISSRMPSAMTHLQTTLGIEQMPLICYNGALILVDQKVVHSTEMEIDILEALERFNNKKEFHVSLYHQDEWYVPEMDFWAQREINNTKIIPTVLSTKEVIKRWKIEKKGAHKIMCMGAEKYIDQAFSFLKENFENRLHLYRSKPTYIEIANKKISKLTAINILLNNYYNIPIENTVAFGDNYNDIAMLNAVGTGVAVANAKPEVLEIANVVTLSGKEDGVATYIKKYI